MFCKYFIVELLFLLFEFLKDYENEVYVIVYMLLISLKYLCFDF